MHLVATPDLVSQQHSEMLLKHFFLAGVQLSPDNGLGNHDAMKRQPRSLEELLDQLDVGCAAGGGDLRPFELMIVAMADANSFNHCVEFAPTLIAHPQAAEPVETSTVHP